MMHVRMLLHVIVCTAQLDMRLHDMYYVCIDEKDVSMSNTPPTPKRGASRCNHIADRREPKGPCNNASIVLNRRNRRSAAQTHQQSRWKATTFVMIVFRL